jgi:UDP-N-acetylmuramate--alanine ligase
MNPGQSIRHIYFLGIGGIGMSAMARYFHSKGSMISGYDRVETPLTKELSNEGMDIHFDDNPVKIPSDIDLTIFTPAIPKELKEFRFLSQKRIPFRKRAEILGMITADKFTIAIAGTHGKTSISSMTAHILLQCGIRVTALVGGICKNYNSNFISSGFEDIMVVEADEYDRSFLQLHPDIAVISSMDPDHLDIYHSGDLMRESYDLFAGQIKPGGRLISKKGLRSGTKEDVHRTEYAAGDEADIHAANIHVENGRHVFDIINSGEVYRNISLKVPGRHNIENALAAVAVCSVLDVPANRIISGLKSFSGVRRRFDVRNDKTGAVYIDDYAHHPEELRAFITAVKEIYTSQPITGIFQPHLYSRTRDFAEGFAASLEMLDEIILLEIYPAREKPMPGVTSRIIYDKIRNPHKKLISKEELLNTISGEKPQVLLTMGAGDIDQYVEPIENLMKESS